MSDSWLDDHVGLLKRTIQRLKAENTSRACWLIERYSRMWAEARLEQIRRSDGD
jgi:hypothetical protein